MVIMIFSHHFLFPAWVVRSLTGKGHFSVCRFIEFALSVVASYFSGGCPSCLCAANTWLLSRIC